MGGLLQEHGHDPRGRGHRAAGPRKFLTLVFVQSNLVLIVARLFFQARSQSNPAAAQPVPTNGAQNGSADYSAQWADYYRSIGKVREAEAIEIQMKQKNGGGGGAPGGPGYPAAAPAGYYAGQAAPGGAPPPSGYQPGYPAAAAAGGYPGYGGPPGGDS